MEEGTWRVGGIEEGPGEWRDREARELKGGRRYLEGWRKMKGTGRMDKRARWI